LDTGSSIPSPSSADSASVSNSPVLQEASVVSIGDEMSAL
jgi:hypothetical protein